MECDFYALAIPQYRPAAAAYPILTQLTGNTLLRIPYTLLGTLLTENTVLGSLLTENIQMSMQDDILGKYITV